VSWNRFDPAKVKADREIRFYVDELRAHAMYRGSESMEAWPDYAKVAAKLAALTRPRR
jgi:hypothetical protein